MRGSVHAILDGCFFLLPLSALCCASSPAQPSPTPPLPAPLSPARLLRSRSELAETRRRRIVTGWFSSMALALRAGFVRHRIVSIVVLTLGKKVLFVADGLVMVAGSGDDMVRRSGTESNGEITERGLMLDDRNPLTPPRRVVRSFSTGRRAFAVFSTKPLTLLQTLPICSRVA